MSVLAIDPGLRCGWAYWRRPWKRPESGVFVVETHRGESPGIRFVRFRRFLEDLTRSTQAQYCVYEIAHHRGGYATELIVGLTTRIQEMAVLAGIEYMGVHTAVLKKWAAGNGRADKEQMIEAAKRMWCVDPADDNEADALCLLGYGMHTWLGFDVREGLPCAGLPRNCRA